MKDGKAHCDEFLGPEASTIQAVHTPEGGSPRWVSEELAYSENAELSTTSKTSAESWTETTNPRQLFSGEEVSLSDTELSARAVPEGEDATRIILEAADKNLEGYVRGGFSAREARVRTSNSMARSPAAARNFSSAPMQATTAIPCASIFSRTRASRKRPAASR